jgi:site-specific recombinase XerD
MASDRDILFSVAHSSIEARRPSGRRSVVIGSRPVAGRPRPRFFFGITFIDLTIFWYYLNMKPREARALTVLDRLMGHPSYSLIISNGNGAAAVLGPELEEAVEYARSAKSPATRRAYRSDFEIFRSWCEAKRLSPLPASAEAVAAFLAFDVKGGTKPTTLSRRLAAIRYAHTLAGHPSPTASEAVKATLRGIKRTVRHRPARKAPATSDRVAAMIAPIGDGARGLRDRALLLLGFAGAFRRSELVALNVEDLEFCEGGLLVTIRKSKTDQEGVGAIIAIARGSAACPVNAVHHWIAASRIEGGPIFRPVSKKGRVVNRRLSDRAVADLVKAYARRAGLKAGDFSAHSLRSGFLTSAARSGASIFKMMDVSRHKTMETLRTYVRDAELFRDHAGSSLL